MSKFLHNDDDNADEDNDNAKAIEIPQVFSKNSQAKNARNQHFSTTFSTIWTTHFCFQSHLICQLL